MNRVELLAANTAVAERVNAALGDLDARAELRNHVVAVFAGTDLPGHDVLSVLAAQIHAHLEGGMFDEVGVIGVMQGLSLNAFLLGFECARRSK